MDLRTTVFAAAALLAVVPSASLVAQSIEEIGPGGPTVEELQRREEMSRRVPVTVALVERLPAGSGDAPAVLLRRTDASPRDVILLRRVDATGAHLAGAILHLMVVRERGGDTASVSGVFRLPTATRGPLAWERTEQVRAERIVARLRHTEPRDVAGVGRVPAKEIYLPSRAMRDAARQRARSWNESRARLKCASRETVPPASLLSRAERKGWGAPERTPHPACRRRKEIRRVRGYRLSSRRAPRSGAPA